MTGGALQLAACVGRAGPWLQLLTVYSAAAISRVPVLTDALLLVCGTIAWLAFSEAFLKPAAISLAYGLGPRAIAEGLAALDQLLPELLEDGVPPDQVEAEVRRRLSAATGAEWTPRRLQALRQLFDPIELIKHQPQR
jgi:hypothetical protein